MEGRGRGRGFVFPTAPPTEEELHRRYLADQARYFPPEQVQDAPEGSPQRQLAPPREYPVEPEVSGRPFIYRYDPVAPGVAGPSQGSVLQAPRRVRPPRAEPYSAPVEPLAGPSQGSDGQAPRRVRPPKAEPFPAVGHTHAVGDTLAEQMAHLPMLGRSRGRPIVPEPLPMGRGRGWPPAAGRGFFRAPPPVGLQEPVGMEVVPPAAAAIQEEELRPRSEMSSAASEIGSVSSVTLEMSGWEESETEDEARTFPVSEASGVLDPSPAPTGRTTLIRVDRSPASAPDSGSGTVTPRSGRGGFQGQRGAGTGARARGQVLIPEEPPVVHPPVQVHAEPEVRPHEPAGEDEVIEVEVEPEVIPPRSILGLKGKPVPVMTNFLNVELAEDKRVYEYITTFTPNLEATKVRKRVIYDVADILGTTRTFDGVKLWLPYELRHDQRTIETAHPNVAGQTVSVSFRLVRKVRLADCIQFYNVLIRRCMAILGFTEMGRVYYDGGSIHNIEQHKLEIWPGYITAIDEYEGGMMLCLDSTHRVLRSTTVLEAITNAARSSRNADWKRKFADDFIGKVVLTRYNGHTYKISDVAWNASPLDTFQKHGAEVDFMKYYLDQYGITIQDKNQPLLLSTLKPRKNDPLGQERAVSLIPELCFVTGLTDDLRQNFNVMRDIIDKSRTTPKERVECIKRFVDNVRENNEASQLLDGWGLKLIRECVVTTARNITGPELIFNPRFSLAAAKPDFSREATSNKCFAPINLRNWLIICTQQDKPKAEQMVNTYKQVVGPLGIQFGPDPSYHIVGNGGRTGTDWANLLRNIAIPGQIQFVVIVLPMAKDELYAAVKNRCVLDIQMPSQVILAKTLGKERQLRSIMQKVALQINCKLGGSIWGLKIPLDFIMFVGIDSHHDPQRKKHSVLALVATLDANCTKYYSRVVPQKSHQEGADPLRAVFQQALATYVEVNNRPPDRLVIFRDGVGDGQLGEVTKNEVPQLKEASDKICKGGYNFTFVVVQKRINERIFIKKGVTLDNPEPGTVLDHTIARRGSYDFFLISQLVKQGTVSPSHYTVLEDCGENKPDLVQRLSYVTAFMYFNWPGTIRVPAMCQYAHKLAMLTGQHLRNIPGQEMANALFYL